MRFPPATPVDRGKPYPNALRLGVVLKHFIPHRPILVEMVASADQMVAHKEKQPRVVADATDVELVLAGEKQVTDKHLMVLEQQLLPTLNRHGYARLQHALDCVGHQGLREPHFGKKRQNPRVAKKAARKRRH